MIHIKNVSYSYPNYDSTKQKRILKDIDFNIREGEFVSVLGKSGCGKTTLVNVLAGYLGAKKGRVLINNIEVKKPGKNRIVVNQENDLFEWMTVWKNMKLVSNNEENIVRCLDLVVLNSFREYFPNNLSGGMKKRLSLARALVVNPDFLILDEPFVSLDHKTREGLHLELDRIFSSTKKTTLLVTHDIEEAIFLSDRIIVLGGNPATVVSSLNIDFPHPRKLGIKSKKLFTNYRNIVKNSYI